MATNLGTYSYPGNVASNPSVGTDGTTAPIDSTLVGGIGPDGNLHGLAVDNNGKLELSVESIEIGTVDQGNPNTIGKAWPVTGTDGTNSQAYTASGEAKVDVTTTVLPPLAATSTKQSDGTQKTQIVDGSGNVIASTSNALNVAVTQALPIGSAIIGKVGIDQTTPGTTNAVQVTQGGNAAVVKAASTAPLATDPALVVAISPNTPAVPVSQIDATASGNITTQNLNPNSGVATAGSSVAVTSLEGQTSWSVQVTGTYTGALTPQVTVDGSNWIALSATAITNINTNAQAATIASAAVGIFEISAPPCAQIRMTALAAVTGTAVVTIRVSSSTTRVGLDSPLPAGTAIIGALSANQSVNNAQINGVTPLMGNGVTGTGSQRVTIASDNTAFSVNATSTPTKGTFTDGSGTTSATPSTATTAAAVNATRKYLFIQNCSSSATIWINFTTTAVANQPSIPLLPYAAYVQESGFISTELISVISTTASAPYVLKQA